MKTPLNLALAAALFGLGAGTAHAYDFNVGNQASSYEIGYVHVHTVSSLCHDRTPVDINSGTPTLKPGTYVSGSTAPGCLIDAVSMYPNYGPASTWSGLGMGGGTFTWIQSVIDAYVCPDDTNCTAWKQP